MNRSLAQYHADRRAEATGCIGETFGIFTVLSIARVDRFFGTMVLCRCGCGTEEVQRLALLRHSGGPKLGCAQCRELRKALRMYPVRGLDARPLWRRVLEWRSR